jgi:hypothetical protein
VAATVEKLATGAPLTIDQLLEYLPQPKGGFLPRIRYKPQQGMGAAARGNFIGCAFCHEVMRP